MLRIVIVLEKQVWSWLPFDVGWKRKERTKCREYVHVSRLVLEPHGNLQEIRSLITRHVSSAQQARLFGRELSYVLPRDEVDR